MRTTLIERFQPATFVERGVAIPFTTPMLSGTRARPDDRSGMELVVPNPGSGQGVYVFNWSHLAKFCQPSLHDLALTERVAALRSLTPATIRRVSREVATEGLAGREVALAADRSRGDDEQATVVTNYHLLVRLMRQIAANDPSKFPAERESALLVQRRARESIAIIAPQIGLLPDQLAVNLEELAEICLRVGVGNAGITAQAPLMIKELHRFRAGIAAWVAARDGDRADQARYILSEADALLELAEPLVAASQRRAFDVLQLLRDYSAAPAKLAAEFARTDWLLDGWALMCARWRAAPPDQYDEVIEELAAMLPPMPAEALEWGYRLSVGIERIYRRHVPAGHDWRTGLLAFQGIERGEQALRLTFESAA